MSRSLFILPRSKGATGWKGLFAIFAEFEFEAQRMSIADHFQHAPDAGFVRNYDGDAARRQFRVSMVLVAVIAAAAAGLAAVVRFDVPSQSSASVASPVAPPHYAGRLAGS